MIRRLVLRNWRSHESTELTFGRGTNLLVGVMGAGKTAVLDAITFALFGTFPALAQKRVRLADVITWGPSPRSQAEILLEFDWGEDSYSIRRTIYRKGSSEAELRKNGSLVMGPQPEKVQEEITRVLKINYDVFYRAIYAEQNRIDYFLTLNPRDRKAQIDELLGIDRFENARANLVSVTNILRRMKEERESVLRGIDEAALRRRRAEAAKEAEELARELEEKRTEQARAKEELAAAEKALAELDARRKEWESLRTRRLGAEQALARLESERVELERMLPPESVDVLERKLGLMAEGLKELKERKRSLEREIADASRSEGELRAKVAELERSAERKLSTEKRLREMLAGFTGRDAVAEAVMVVRAGIDEENAVVGRSGAKIEQLEHAMHELERETAACPVCERPIDEELRAKLIGRRREQLDAERKAATEAKERLATLVAKHERLEKLLKEITACEERLAELAGVEEELSKAKDAHAQARKKLGELEAARSELELKVEEKEKEVEAGAELLRRAREHEQLAARQASLRKELAELSSALGRLHFDESALEKLREEVGKKRMREATLSGEARLVESRLESARERLEEAARSLAHVESQREEVARHGMMIENLTIFHNSVVETQATLRAELIEAINATMGELWPIIYPYRDYAGLRLRAGESDYQLELKVGEAWLPVERIASGGERSCASLALRIAFAMVLVPNLKWLILDEPTHNLDEQGIGALVEVLRDRIPEIVEQVFVITHDESLKEAASARLYRFDRNKERGEPTRVVALN